MLACSKEDFVPYVKNEYRGALDAAISDLAGRIVAIAQELPEETAFAGLLNYACTSLAMQVIDRRFGKLRYGTIATVTGVFKNIADEFYRRVGVPYEDLQMEKSGDLPLYAEYAARR